MTKSDKYTTESIIIMDKNLMILYVELNLGVSIFFLLNMLYHNLYGNIEIKNVVAKSIRGVGKPIPSISSPAAVADAKPKAPTGPNIKPNVGASAMSTNIKLPPIRWHSKR